MRNFLVLMIIGWVILLSVMALGVADKMTEKIENRVNVIDQLIERN